MVRARRAPSCKFSKPPSGFSIGIGYNGSGRTRDRCRSGRAEGVVRHTSASKEALGIAALQRYWEGGATLLENGFATTRSRQPTAFGAYFQVLADITRRAEHRFAGMIGNLGSSTWRRPLHRSGRDRRDHGVMERAIAAASAMDSATIDTWRHGTEGIGLFLLDAWEGALLRAKVDRSEAPIAAFMTIALRAVLTAAS